MAPRPLPQPKSYKCRVSPQRRLSDARSKAWLAQRLWELVLELTRDEFHCDREDLSTECSDDADLWDVIPMDPAMLSAPDYRLPPEGESSWQ